MALKVSALLIFSMAASLVAAPAEFICPNSGKLLNFQDEKWEPLCREIRAFLSPHQQDLEALFTLEQIEEQTKYLAPQTPLGSAIDEAFDCVFSIEKLTPILGRERIELREQSFSRYFAERVRFFLSNHLASSSPELAHLLFGPQIQIAPFLAEESCVLNEDLSQVGPESYDFIHLSDSLDALSPKEAQRVLKLAFRALKENGRLIIEQGNSHLDLSAFQEDLIWERDQSLFHQEVHVGVKKNDFQEPELLALRERMLSDEIQPVLPDEKIAPMNPWELFVYLELNRRADCVDSHEWERMGLFSDCDSWFDSHGDVERVAVGQRG